MISAIIWTNAIFFVLYVLNRRFDLLSKASTIYLRLRYPIRDFATGASLPTLPHVFPNGQGNVEKFLHGHENSLKWGEGYGRLYRIWSGFHGEIILTRPADIEVVFRDSHNHLKANSNDSGYIMHQLLGSCMGLVSGAEWKSIRRATEAPFTRNATTAYVDIVRDHAKQHIQSLFDIKGDSVGGRMQPYADLRVYPFIALADILYGGLTPDLKARMIAMIPGRDSVFIKMIEGGLSRFPISRFLPLPAIRELHWFKTTWAAWNDDAHAEALKKSEGGEEIPIVQMYSAVADGTMSREALLQTLDEMLFANLDVAIGALSWSLVFLSAFPEAMARLRREIKTDLTPENETAYLMSNSNYLHHVLLETGRLRPVTAFSVAQACPTARQIDNYVFPAGTKFVIDSISLNVRDQLWAPDNEAFRPERWQEGGVQRAKDIRYCYWRFGFGPRLCLGKYVVDLMMKALIIEMVTGWDLKLERDDGTPWVWNQDSWTIDPALRIACSRRRQQKS